MCKSDDVRKESPPSAMRVDSAINGSDDSESDDNSSNSGQRQVPQRDQRSLPPSAIRRKLKDFLINHDKSKSTDGSKQQAPTLKIFGSIVSCLSGVVHAAFWVTFSLYFPFLLAPQAAKATYYPAYYHYDPERSRFDNTIWTYGTDYALAVIMAVVSLSIMHYWRRGVSDKLCNRSASLLLLYGISVIAGGCSHQFFLTNESRNTLAFRTLWTICVGTVCLASCSMGMSGSEALFRFQQKELQIGDASRLQRIPVISDMFWLAFGVTVTAVCGIGVMSFQRPACDIFIAGITQSPSTFYCMIFFSLVRHPRIESWAKVVGLVGFILNAPLLPMYPLLVQYTDWSLGSVNTLLHSWLCVAWTMQGISMQHVIQALVADDDNNVVVAEPSSKSNKLE